MVDTKLDYHVTASLPYAWGHLCMMVVAVVELVEVVAGTLELQTYGACMEPVVHGMCLIQIVLNSWYNHGMDSPYHDTCWVSVDSMLQK